MIVALCVSHLGTGGTERVVTKIANYWAQRGHVVYIFTIASIDTGCSYTLNSKVKWISLYSHGGESLSKLRKVFLLRGSIKKLNLDVVISFGVNMNILLLIVLYKLGIPHIISERNNPQYLNSSVFRKAGRKFIYPLSDLLVVQTDRISMWFKQKKINIPIKVIPNFVEEPTEKIDESSLIKKSKTLITVGSLTKQKGHDRLIRMFRNVYNKDQELNLLIVGEGPERAKLKRLVSEYKLENQIEFVGKVKNPITYLRKAGLFVFTSYWEGFPNALIEAMAFGLPVISFDCPTGPSEIIQNQYNGILVPNGNEESFERAILMMVSNKDKRLMISSNSKKIFERYHIERIMPEWEKAVTRCSDRKPLR